MSGSAVRWAIRNAPAMNMMVVAVLVVGTISAFLLRREVFPQFELEIILVSVPYPEAPARTKWKAASARRWRKPYVRWMVFAR